MRSLFVFLLLTGCDGRSRCTPGASVACACSDGNEGAQTCNAGGSFDACQCLTLGVPNDMSSFNSDLAHNQLTSRPDMASPADLRLASDLAKSHDLTLPGKGFFISSVAYTGDLIDVGSGSSGLQVADNLCTSLASSASLGGTWKAWLSDSHQDAIDRIVDVGPWYLMDGPMVFQDKANLMTSPMVKPLVDETGSTNWSWMYTWTGYGAVNTTMGDHACSDWGGTSLTGVVGNPFSKAEWNLASSSTPLLDCSQMAHLYCIEQ